MKINGFGGGNTRTGLNFEKSTDILTLLNLTEGYSVNGNIIYFEGVEVARSLKKNALYVYLKSKGVDYKLVLSKKLLPDDAIYVIVNNTLYIIEVKFQLMSSLPPWDRVDRVEPCPLSMCFYNS